TDALKAARRRGLPERPLPERWLPERWLPERWLPERPLPERRLRGRRCAGRKPSRPQQAILCAWCASRRQLTSAYVVVAWTAILPPSSNNSTSPNTRLRPCAAHGP